MAAKPSVPTTSSFIKRAAALLGLGALAACAGLGRSTSSREVSQVWHTEMELGDSAFHQGLQLEAAAHYGAAAEAARRLPAPGSRLAESLASEAAVERMEGRYARAVELYQESVKVLEGVPGAAYPRLTAAFYNLAQAQSLGGRAAEAQAAYRRFVDLSARAPEPGSGNLAAWLITAGQFFHAQGSYAEALSCYRRALTIGEKAPAPDAAALSALRDDIRSVLKAQGQDEARP